MGETHGARSITRGQTPRSHTKGVTVSPWSSHLVDERPPEGVGLQQHAGPKLGVLAADQVAGQALEQRVFIADLESTTTTILDLTCFASLQRATGITNDQSNKCKERTDGEPDSH